MGKMDRKRRKTRKKITGERKIRASKYKTDTMTSTSKSSKTITIINIYKIILEYMLIG